MVTEVTYVIVNDVKQLLTNPSNTCVDDRGVLQERMRNRSCVGWELILDFLAIWISFFVYVLAFNIRFGWGYELLVLCKFCFLQLMIILSVNLEQEQPNNARIK